MTIAMIVGAEHSHVIFLDIDSAYLNAAMPKTDLLKAIHMRISPEIATLLIKLEPSMNQYTMKNGCIIVSLDQALYRCVKSAVL